MPLDGKHPQRPWSPGQVPNQQRALKTNVYKLRKKGARFLTSVPIDRRWRRRPVVAIVSVTTARLT